jgi:choline-glycine betaine transporter
MANAMEIVSRGVFGIASLVLMLIALALSFYSASLIVSALGAEWGEAGPALLGAIGYVVIAMAVFDVAKYFVEEEVIRGREMRLASEARRSLTKFMSTIVIAVFIEALVMVFREGSKDITRVLYPAAILFMGILTVLALGLYQRLSADVEEQVDEKDKVHEKAAPKPKKT